VIRTGGKLGAILATAVSLAGCRTAPPEKLLSAKAVCIGGTYIPKNHPVFKPNNSYEFSFLEGPDAGKVIRCECPPQCPTGKWIKGPEAMYTRVVVTYARDVFESKEWTEIFLRCSDYRWID
jgi:hypothetical protein